MKTRALQMPALVCALGIAAVLATSGCVPTPPPPAAGSPESTPPVSNPTPTPTPTTSPTPAAAPTSPSPSPANWAGTVADVRSGVAKITVTLCEGSGVGTGFLVQDDLIVTAAHVVEDHAAISISVGTQITGAQVLGMDVPADLALLRTDRPVAGHIFDFHSVPPALGEEVAALGYPLGDELTFTAGRVSGLDRQQTIAGNTVTNLIQTDAAINPGNSGGPLLTMDGKVAGIVSSKRAWILGSNNEIELSAEGTAYAVDARKASLAVEGWQTSPHALTAANCGRQLPADASAVAVTVDSDHPQAPDIAQSLVIHGQSINRGAYDVAFAILTPEMQAKMGGLELWQSGLASSFWRALSVDEVVAEGGRLKAFARLRTVQDAQHGPEGQTCSDWSVGYVMHWDGSIWRIADALEVDGPPRPC